MAAPEGKETLCLKTMSEETSGNTVKVLASLTSETRWCAGTHEMLLLLDKMDPERKDKEIRKELKDACKLKEGWKNPVYDAVIAGAPFYLSLLRNFLETKNRLPTDEERESLWYDT